MRDEILRALLNEPVVSGGKLSETLGVTRSAVWKQIMQLRESGFDIETIGRQGYHLVKSPDLLMAPLIEYELDTRWAGRDVHYFDSVDSTNRVLKKMAMEGAEHGTLVLAEEQTGGRGRRGRGWLTPKGTSIAMSLLLRPNMHPSKVAILSLATSVAVARGIRTVTRLPARIKWPNDIVCNGKKVCGILLEMDANEQQVEYVVSGMGINVHMMEIPAEIRTTATSLDIECGHPVSRIEIVQAVMRAFEETEYMIREGVLMEVYQGLSATLGRQVSVLGITEKFTGTAESVREDGALLVRTGAGELREVLAGDVSVRGIMGYV